MTVQVVSGSNVGTGLRLNLGSVDSVTVTATGVIESTDGYRAIVGVGSNHVVQVDGRVATSGTGTAIVLGTAIPTDVGQSVLVGATGHVVGGSIAIEIASEKSSVTNNGSITSGVGGIAFQSSGATTQSTVTNTGDISGTTYGIAQFYTEGLTIINSGTISGGTIGIQGGFGRETIVNTGEITGGILLAEGNDRYDGRGGIVHGTIGGGDGNDVFLPGGSVDVIDGSVGIDTLDFRTDVGLRVALDGSLVNTGRAAGDTYSNIENVLGSSLGNDTIRGGSIANSLSGYGGSDLITGRAGNDKVYGGANNDSVYGDDGADILSGGADNDRAYGGIGNDSVYGDAGADALSGGADNDKAYGGLGNDSVYGGLGNDTLTGDADNDRVSGGAGNDSVYGSLGRDILSGDAGVDRLYGGADYDRLYGGAGIDAVFGGAGGDYINGGIGADVVFGGAGSDRFVFNHLTEAGDKINDFTNLSGNNDSFRFAAADFGGLALGGLAASRFHSGTTNHAGDSNDRFIFRTTDKTLWFDANGSGAGGLTLVADLQANATVTAGDIILI